MGIDGLTTEHSVTYWHRFAGIETSAADAKHGKECMVQHLAAAARQ
jgi:hypothetical protein